eukprot:gene8643-10257_t
MAKYSKFEEETKAKNQGVRPLSPGLPEMFTALGVHPDPVLSGFENFSEDSPTHISQNPVFQFLFGGQYSEFYQYKKAEAAAYREPSGAPASSTPVLGNEPSVDPAPVPPAEPTVHKDDPPPVLIEAQSPQHLNATEEDTAVVEEDPAIMPPETLPAAISAPEAAQEAAVAELPVLEVQTTDEAAPTEEPEKAVTTLAVATKDCADTANPQSSLVRPTFIDYSSAVEAREWTAVIIYAGSRKAVETVSETSIVSAMSACAARTATPQFR